MISVLMSIYGKEKPENLERALESVYQQSLVPDEVVLVEDGPIGDELKAVMRRYPKLKLVRLPINQQLGRALKAGLKECSNEIIARMDSDDIAVPDRLKLQIEYLQNHPDVSAVGSDIVEFEQEGKALRVKHMPSNSKKLYQYGKLRNPLNHMTVMFRKSDIEEVGGYRHFPLLEDYYLWIRLLAKGYKIANIPQALVWARIGSNFASKRGGYKYYRKYKKLRFLQLKLGYTNIAEYIIGVLISFLMTMQPSVVRDVVYRVIRRTSKR